MLKLHILEKVMQVVTTVSKVVHTVKEKIHEVAEQVEARYQKVKEEKAKKAQAAKESRMEEVNMEKGLRHFKARRRKSMVKNQAALAAYALYMKEDGKKQLGVYKKENNVIYLTSAFKEVQPVLKAYDDLYSGVKQAHSREPTIDALIAEEVSFEEYSP